MSPCPIGLNPHRPYPSRTPDFASPRPYLTRPCCVARPHVCLHADPADPITRHNKLYRLTIDRPADAKSNFRGGCLTRGHGSTGAGSVAYVAECLPLTSGTSINVNAHSQQWALIPVTLEGRSGYRVCHRVSSYCLQMGDDLFSGDRVYDRWSADDVRQMFAIVSA